MKRSGFLKLMATAPLVGVIPREKVPEEKVCEPPTYACVFVCVEGERIVHAKAHDFEKEIDTSQFDIELRDLGETAELWVAGEKVQEYWGNWRSWANQYSGIVLL